MVLPGLSAARVACMRGTRPLFARRVAPGGGERASDLPDISQQEEFDPAPMGADWYEYRDQDGKLVFWIVREQWWDDERGRTVRSSSLITGRRGAHALLGYPRYGRFTSCRS